MAHEEEMMEFETFTLTMEDDTEQDFAIIDEFEFEDKMYMIASPINGDLVEEEMVMFRFREDGEAIIVEYIDDDEEHDRAADAYAAMCEEKMDCDCEDCK